MRIDYLNKFVGILWRYDTQHAIKASKNKRIHRNPNAIIHYTEALNRAREMVSDPGDLGTVLKALNSVFEPSFHPLKTFIKETRK